MNESSTILNAAVAGVGGVGRITAGGDRSVGRDEDVDGCCAEWF